MFPPSRSDKRTPRDLSKKKNCTLRLSLTCAENHSRNWAFPNYFLSCPPRSAWAAETSVSVSVTNFHNQLKIYDQCSSKSWWTKKQFIELVDRLNHHGNIVKSSGEANWKSGEIPEFRLQRIWPEKTRFAVSWSKILLPHHLIPRWSVSWIKNSLFDAKNWHYQFSSTSRLIGN